MLRPLSFPLFDVWGVKMSTWAGKDPYFLHLTIFTCLKWISDFMSNVMDTIYFVNFCTVFTLFRKTQIFIIDPVQSLSTRSTLRLVSNYKYSVASENQEDNNIVVFLWSTIKRSFWSSLWENLWMKPPGFSLNHFCRDKKEQSRKNKSSFRLFLMTKRLIDFSNAVGKKNQSKSIITITTVRASEGKHSSCRLCHQQTGGAGGVANNLSQTPVLLSHKTFSYHRKQIVTNNKNMITTFKTKVETVSHLWGSNFSSWLVSTGQ